MSHLSRDAMKQREQAIAGANAFALAEERQRAFRRSQQPETGMMRAYRLAEEVGGRVEVSEHGAGAEAVYTVYDSAGQRLTVIRVDSYGSYSEGPSTAAEE